MILDDRQGAGDDWTVDLVGVAEIAQMIGVTRQRVHELSRADLEFPEPVAELSAGRIWRKTDVESWMTSRDRREKQLETRRVADVAVMSPVVFSEMQAVGDAIRAAEMIVVDLRRIDVVQMRRCIDFLAGAGYVAGARVDRVADRAYLVSPANASVTDDQRREIVADLEPTGAR